MPTGFNPFSIPNVPNVTLQGLPQLNTSAGLQALLAVQNAIARQRAMAARAAGRGNVSGEHNPKYTAYTKLPLGNGEFETVAVEGPDEKARTALTKQLHEQRWDALAAKDKDLQESLAKMDTLSVAGQAKEIEKIRKQIIPGLVKRWGVSPDVGQELIRRQTYQAEENRRAREAAVKDVSWWDKFTDSAQIGLNSLVDSIKTWGKTPQEQLVLGKERQKAKQDIISQNIALEDRERARREGNDTWRDYFDSATFGDMLSGAGGLMTAQALPRVAGGLLRMIPHPATQAAATFVQGATTAGALGRAAAMGAAAGAPLGQVELVDRLMEDPNLTDAQRIEAIDRGQLPAMTVGALTGAIPLGVAQTGLPFISRGANTMFGRAAIQKAATREAVKDLGTAGYFGSNLRAAADAAGKNAVADAVEAYGKKGFLKRYANAIVPTAVDMSALSAVNQAGQNLAYGYGTGQDVPILQGVGDAALMGAATAPFFGVLNAGRPIVPARQPVPETTSPYHLALPEGTPPTNRPWPPLNDNPYSPWSPGGAGPVSRNTPAPSSARRGPSGVTLEGAQRLGEFMGGAKQWGPKQYQTLVGMLRDGKVTADDMARAIGQMPDGSRAATIMRMAHSDYLTMYDSWQKSRAAQMLPAGSVENAEAVGLRGLPIGASDVAVRRSGADAVANAVRIFNAIPKDAPANTHAATVYDLIFTNAITPDEAVKAIKNSKGVPAEQKRAMRRAVNNAKDFIKTQEILNGQGTADSVGGASGAAITLGRDGQLRKGSPDTANTVGRSETGANTETVVDAIANEISNGPVGNNQTVEVGRDARLSAQNTGTPQADAGVIAKTPGEQRQAANGESGGGSPAEQLAQPDIRERGDQPAGSASEGGYGASEPVGANKPDTVKAEQASLFDSIETRAKAFDADNTGLAKELGMTEPESAPAKPKRAARKKAEVSEKDVLGKLDELTPDQWVELKDNGFLSADNADAASEILDVMRRSAAKKKLEPEEKTLMKRLKKYGVPAITPVIREEAKTAAKKGRSVGLKTTEEGQELISTEQARKKVDENPYCLPE